MYWAGVRIAFAFLREGRVSGLVLLSGLVSATIFPLPDYSSVEQILRASIDFFKS